MRPMIARHWVPACAGTTLVQTTFLLVLLVFPGFAHATTLRTLTLEELVASSALIFTGEVIDVSSSVEGELVYTTVEFAVSEVVEGEFADATLALRFLGGSSGELRTEVAGQFVPALGDRGLYLVDALDRTLVNPLTGWSQGYFPLLTAADGTQWLDLKDHPDYGVLVENADPLAGKMRDLGFTRAQVAERFPEQLRYPLTDFIEVIHVVAAQPAE